MLIEKLIMEYFVDAGITAYPEEPEDAPAKYVTIEKTGGSCKNFLHTSKVLLNVYAESMYKTAEYLETVKEVMNGLVNNPDISSISLEDNGNGMDEVRKRYRYQAVYTIKHY
ncbi:MAG: hypothetical protein NC393_08105 [Clostridium sp.]|nr:hypothetical protein [Clostridium sp.]MCM1207648.1 hypothetical protein [Ruminococcus sp.]